MFGFIELMVIWWLSFRRCADYVFKSGWIEKLDAWAATKK